MNKFKDKYKYVPYVTAVLFLAAFIISTIYLKPSINKDYTNFLTDLKSNKISKVYITNAPTITVKLTDNSQYNTDNPRSDSFKETLLTYNIKVIERSPMPLTQVIPVIGFSISLVIIFISLLKNTNLTSSKLFSLTSIEAEAVENPQFTFEDVAGNEEAKESVQDVVDFLKNPDKYTSYGARMPKGIILYGEPGTGKTLLAKAVAGEANVPFYAVSGSDFIQIYVGVGAGRIRSLFKKARSHGKAVIFIDEIDAIGKKRDNGKAGSSDERDQTLNALLTEMSGFNEKEGIVIIAATNRLDMLDPALLRPGRFDRHIEVSLPDTTAREKILELHFKNKPSEKINIKEWAQKTSYFSGAKLENLVNEAAILACKENSTKILDSHLDKAFSIVLAGYEKKDRSFIKEKDRKITAYHEAGHALITNFVLPQEKISKITIIPSTKGAGGYTLSVPEDSMYHSKKYLESRIMVLLGGRAAEEIIFGKEYITTGAFSDLKQSTNIALNMITRYGMGSTLGLLSLESIPEIENEVQGKYLSECKLLINNLYEQTKTLLINEKDLLITLSEELLKVDTLNNEDIIKILNREKAYS